MTNTNIRLSVIIPVYNAEKYIGRCLDSIFSQNMQGIEVICVDDGSSDSSLIILEKYAEEHKEMHVLKQKNMHAGIARNVGMDIAQGEYIHFLDSDDYLFPNVYEDMYALAKKNRLDYLKVKIKCFDATTGEFLKNQQYKHYSGFMKENDYNRIVDVNSFPLGLINNQVVTPWSGIYRREFLEKHFIRFNNLKCVNDRSFYIQVILNAKRIQYMDMFAVAHQVDNEYSLKGIRGDNFDCHFRSYYEIESLTNECDTELQKKILLEEIYDIAYWYGKLSDVQMKKAKYELYRFFAGVDWSKIGRSNYLFSIMTEINSSLRAYGQAEIIDISSIVSQCRNIKTLYIYGAGAMGKKLICHLIMNNIKPTCVIVSKTASEERLEGIEIKRIDSVEFPRKHDGVVVFLAAKSIYHIQMIRSLIGREIEKIITLSDQQFDEL